MRRSSCTCARCKELSVAHSSYHIHVNRFFLLQPPATVKMTSNPNVNFARGTAHNTTVTTGAKDLVGNPLAREKVWSFTTAR
jgi:hypothetical protein